MGAVKPEKWAVVAIVGVPARFELSYPFHDTFSDARQYARERHDEAVADGLPCPFAVIPLHFVVGE